jgi:hypothetical protein
LRRRSSILISTGSSTQIRNKICIVITVDR